jgi:hypothetical protein
MNAKEEILDFLSDNNLILIAAEVRYEPYWDSKLHSMSVLFERFNQAEKIKFLESLDFEYDAGYGCQELFGNLWFSDGTWAIRSEYDGSEWWERIIKPKIPTK